jgi:ABC-type protease/lipase transport system fused ATPase/permease subunit
MAKLSRNARAKARKKRTISQLTRALRTVQSDFVRTQMTLLAVLAQKGGSVVVTAGTMQQVTPAMGWEMAPVEGITGEWEVRVVTRGDEATPYETIDEEVEPVVEP